MLVKLAAILACLQLLAVPCVHANTIEAHASDSGGHCSKPARSPAGANCPSSVSHAADISSAQQQLERLVMHAALVHGNSFILLGVLHDPPDITLRDVKVASHRPRPQELCVQLK